MPSIPPSARTAKTLLILTSGYNRETQMADNDYAVGRLIEKIAKSPYKNQTLIFIIEDDAQDGSDHVDSHRSIAYIVGPYVKQGALVSTHYTTVSMLRTIEEVPGLKPLGINDGLTAPMADLFNKRQRSWDYQALVPQILYSTQLDSPPQDQVEVAAARTPCDGAPARDGAIGRQRCVGKTSRSRIALTLRPSTARCGPASGAIR